VVETGCPAILTAVDRFVTIRVEVRERSGLISSPHVSGTPLSWIRADLRQLTADHDQPFRFILSAIDLTENYVRSTGKSLNYYCLNVTSDLDGADGKKYGLGSSAAVTAATVRALLTFYHLSPDNRIIFKLAALAHLNVQGNGSCGDIAASVYGGWLAYTAFDHNWLVQETRSGMRLQVLLSRSWPELSIIPLDLPVSLELLVGWTGSTASTHQLVDHVARAKRNRAAEYQHFLTESTACVKRMIAGFQQQRPEWIQAGVRTNRKLLRALEDLSGTRIETDKLYRLCEIAERYGGAAKSSGAGGGDCGIVLADQTVSKTAIWNEWRLAGIEPLCLKTGDKMANRKEGQTVTESRKDEHVRLFRENDVIDPVNDFDSVRFVHQSLPELDLDQVDLSARLPFSTWPVPFYINGMTGGSEKTKRINEQLSRAAAATGVAIASGSQKAAIRDPDLRSTFQVLRQVNPNGFIFANIGAELDAEAAKQAIDMLEANGLQIHLNAPQEVVMPEGDRRFSAWLSHVEQIVAAVDLPVVVKEVGFGMSRKVLRQLLDAGVKYIDVSGRGGTNFITIENMRRGKHEFDYLKDWGQSAVISLLEAQHVLGEATFLASGGVRNPLDVLKALSLGAGAVGISGAFLRAVLHGGADELTEKMTSWKQQLVQLLLMMGVRNLEELRRQDLILSDAPYHWAKLRGVSPEKLAMRSWQES
jgi:phosphomevalonate kinase, ERG8-type, Gram-positive branch/isopentenyl-diphosphate delta-isomerase, type 2